MGEGDLEDWKERNSLLVGNGDRSQGAITAEPGRLILETEQDHPGAHTVEREDRVLP